MSEVHTADGEFFIPLLLIHLHEIGSPYFDSACALCRLHIQVEANGSNAEITMGGFTVLLGSALHSTCPYGWHYC